MILGMHDNKTFYQSGIRTYGHVRVPYAGGPSVALLKHLQSLEVILQRCCCSFAKSLSLLLIN